LVRLPQYSTRALLLLVTCCSLLCALWTQVVVPAREAARRTVYTNNLFQHSGWHPSDIVSLDQNGDVVSVASCPVCSTSAAPTLYHNASGVFVEEVELSPQTVDAARQKLLRYKAEPRYRFIRGLMLHADEPQAEQKARARYFHLRGTRQEGDGRLAKPARAPEPAAASVNNGASSPPAR
jgi:hypothetical protein